MRHRIDSKVPDRHRSTGRPPTEKHPAGEDHRDERMRSFFAQLVQPLPVGDGLLHVGDGEVAGLVCDRSGSPDRGRIIDLVTKTRSGQQQLSRKRGR